MKTHAAPSMNSGRFETRMTPGVGFAVRLADNHEAYRFWSVLGLNARGKAAVFAECEEWCASVLAHVDGQLMGSGAALSVASHADASLGALHNNAATSAGR